MEPSISTSTSLSAASTSALIRPTPNPFSRAPSSADSLPNELLLFIFPHLPLTSLAAARAVCRRWRSLVGAAPLLPARRRLLKVLVEGSCVAAGRRHRRICKDVVRRKVRTGEADEAREVREDVAGEQAHGEMAPARKAAWGGGEETFDREAYLRVLQAAGRVPDEFACWMREWPAHAAWAWVGVGVPLLYPNPTLSVFATGRARPSSGDGTVSTSKDEQRQLQKQRRALAPYLNCVTFRGAVESDSDGPNPSGSRSTVLHATKILPVELSELGVRHDVVGREEGYGEDIDAEEGADDDSVTALDAFYSGSRASSSVSSSRSSPSAIDSPASTHSNPCTGATTGGIEVTLLTLSNGRVYVLDGRCGGEALVGRVYAPPGGSYYRLCPERVYAESWAGFLERKLRKKDRKSSGGHEDEEARGDGGESEGEEGGADEVAE